MENHTQNENQLSTSQSSTLSQLRQRAAALLKREPEVTRLPGGSYVAVHFDWNNTKPLMGNTEEEALEALCKHLEKSDVVKPTTV